MCGIIGAFAFSYKGRDFFPAVYKCNQVLEKRGPDGEGVYVNDEIAFGHRRLSIIDVSSAGDQPMHSADGRYTIVYNGEVFNYKKLQAQYLSAEEQRILRSHSDTEVLLCLYSKLKEKTFELLEGFFAAAIYDHKADELVLVRDRYGKKPLLYYSDADKFLFASEMKALFAFGIPKEIDWPILPVYFQLNYIPQPHSLIKNVQKIKAGHFLKINKKGIIQMPWYTLSLQPQKYNTYTYQQAKKKLVELMDNAVQKRLIADVPLGCFLSGGIDSSVIVALAAKHEARIKTFSIGYKDNPFFDETAYANLVAKKYNTDHTVFSLSNTDFLEHVQNVLEYIDEPFADSSAIPEFILSFYTRKHVTVALSGDGGDEVFAGYSKHAAELRMRNGGVLNSLVKYSYPLLSVLPQSRNNKLTNIIRQLSRFASGARLNAADRYWQWAALNNNLKVTSLFQEKVQEKITNSVSENIKNEFSGQIKGQDFNEILLADMNLVLLSDMLVKVDLMSMANSLEIRSPFLDHHVVEFAFSLPYQFKIDATMKKKIVQDAFRNSLPEELYNRPKRGFEIPLLDWFRNELWSLIDDDLLEESFVKEQGIFDISVIQKLKTQLKSASPGDSHATIWALIVFQYWWKHYIAC